MYNSAWIIKVIPTLLYIRSPSLSLSLLKKAPNTCLMDDVCLSHLKRNQIIIMRSRVRNKTRKEKNIRTKKRTKKRREDDKNRGTCTRSPASGSYQLDAGDLCCLASAQNSFTCMHACNALSVLNHLCHILPYQMITYEHIS